MKVLVAKCSRCPAMAEVIIDKAHAPLLDTIKRQLTKCAECGSTAVRQTVETRPGNDLRRRP